MNDSAVLDLARVGVAYAGRPVLRDVDLVVGTGEVVALLGANGSGKSTLVKAAVGLVPHTGDVRLFDTPLGSFRHWERLGYVPQRVAAQTGVPATVWEVVASGRLARRPLLRPLRRADREAITRAIEIVGLTEKVKQPVATLSGGQQQRVLTARALAGEPDLMVLDEPNAGVDHESQERLAQALAASPAGSSARTLVLVLHELGPFAPLIDRVVLLREGRVRYDGPPSGLGVDHRLDHGDHHPDHTRARAHVISEIRAPLERP